MPLTCRVSRSCLPFAAALLGLAASSGCGDGSPDGPGASGDPCESSPGACADAGGPSTGTDAGAGDAGGHQPRLRCVDPLTGEQRGAGDIVELEADIEGRFVGEEPDALCLVGNGHKVDQGRVEPEDAYTWTPTESGDFWEENYHSSDNTVAMRVARPIVENLAVYNTGNGVVFGEQAEYMAVRDVYIQHAGDDGIETDYLLGGVIDDVLIDKAFVALAWRMSSAPCFDKPNNVVKVENSILRVFPQYGIYPGWTDEPIPGYGTVFKWEKECEFATKLELRNTIIVANQDGMASDNLNLDANGNLTVSENNVLVWLGDEPYTGTVPPGFTVTSDVEVFVDAWHDWFARHPDIPKPSAEPDIDYDLPPLQ